MRKHSYILNLLFVFVLVIGMMFSPGATMAESDEVELIMWVNNWAWEAIDAIQTVADIFAERDPYVKSVDIQIVGQIELPERLTLGVVAGTPPDLITIPSPVITYQMPGLIQPLDQFVDRSDVISQEDYPPAIFDSFAIDGVPYGVPAVEVAPGLILVYNQRLFLESGLSAEGPETLDDVIQAHRALSRYTHDGEALEQLGMDPMGAMPSVYFTEVWEAVFDVEDWYDEETHTIDVSRFDDAYEFIRQVYEIPGYDDIRATGLFGWSVSMTSERLGMQINGAWVPGELMAYDSPVRHDVAYTWMPSIKGDKATASLPWGLAIPEGTPNAEHAFRLIEMFTTEEAAQIIFDATGWLNGNLTAMRALDPGEVPDILTIMAMYDEADRFGAPKQIPLIQTVRERLAQAAHDISSGETGVVAAREETQRLLEVLLREFWEDN